MPEGLLADRVHRFFYALDETAYDTLLALFAPTARWHRQGAILQGREQIADALHARPLQRIRHVITNTMSDVRAHDADVVSYMTAYRQLGTRDTDAPPTIAGPFRVSIVHTHFVLMNDDWLIDEMRFATQFEMSEIAC